MFLFCNKPIETFELYIYFIPKSYKNAKQGKISACADDKPGYVFSGLSVVASTSGTAEQL